MPDCDVVIVNFNAGSLLGECVGSVLAAGGRAIVVDNASVDGSVDALAQRFGDADGLMVIRNPRNLGFAVANNIGARATTAPHILFLNPDCFLDPPALTKMRSVLDSTPDIGMVGGLLCNPDGSEQPGGRRLFPTPRRAFIRAFGLSRLGKWFPSLFSDFLLHKKPLPTAPVPVEAISGACLLVKRSAMTDVGIWDEDYFLHCEDLDLCMRFKQKGWKIVFVPDARVVHVKGACSRSRPFFVEWHKHYSMLRFYRKFFRHRYPGLLWVAVVAGVWLRFCLISTNHTVNLVLVKLGAKRA